jgi:hypothetical protein
MVMHGTSVVGQGLMVGCVGCGGVSVSEDLVFIVKELVTEKLTMRSLFLVPVQ